MESTEIVSIGRDLLITTLWLVGPAVLCSILVGVTVSVLQTITSVQDQTLSFAPRIVSVGLIMLIALPWMVQMSSSFTIRMMSRMLQVTQ
ncbi:MAG: flagellar biosynthetic protein FliQ [Fuerstiella sp.]